jgi:hypothetical protein
VARQRQLVALLIVSCAGVLAFGPGPASAAAPATEPPPTELWQEYPLEPLAGQAQRERLPGAEPPAGKSSSVDRMLLIGGLALFVLVLSDTVFLALSSRTLRGTP